MPSSGRSSDTTLERLSWRILWYPLELWESRVSDAAPTSSAEVALCWRVNTTEGLASRVLDYPYGFWESTRHRLGVSSDEVPWLDLDSPDGDPIFFFCGEVITRSRSIGSISLWIWDVRSVAIYAELHDGLPGRSDKKDETMRPFRYAEEACAHLVSSWRGQNPEPLLQEVRRLFRLQRDVLRRELSLRHGWDCHICGTPVPRRYRTGPLDEGDHADPRFPEIEHVVPRHYGGPHWWPNLRLAHKACNNAKRDGDSTLRRDADALLKQRITGYMQLPVPERRQLRELFKRGSPLQ